MLIGQCHCGALRYEVDGAITCRVTGAAAVKMRQRDKPVNLTNYRAAGTRPCEAPAARATPIPTKNNIGK